MEAEYSIGVEGVQGRPTSVPVISKLSMRAIARYPILLPLLDVRFGNVAVVLCVTRSVHEVGDFTEGFDADNALQGEIGLKWEPASKVISADCNSCQLKSQVVPGRCSRWLWGSRASSTR